MGKNASKFSPKRQVLIYAMPFYSVFPVLPAFINHAKLLHFDQFIRSNLTKRPI